MPHGMLQKHYSILLVEDNDEHASLMVKSLARWKNSTVKVERVALLQDGLDLLKSKSFDAILLDLSLPDSAIHETLPNALDAAGDIPIVVLTSHDDEEIAVKALKRGAQDYLSKQDFSARSVLRSLRYAVERKRSEIKARSFAQQLQASNKELEQFARFIAHDLKTPLSGVIGFSEILKEQYGSTLEPTALEYLNRTIRTARRMVTMINDTLALARVDSAKSKPTQVSFSETIKEATFSLQHTIQKSGAKVIHGDLPVVFGDRHQLVLLMQNLIGNAVKYQKDEEPRINIEVLTLSDHWQVNVSDNGVGIAEGELAKIFEPYHRAAARPKNVDGTGLGLAICKKIIDRHGGMIWASAAKPSGTTFSFTLPKDSSGKYC